MVKKKKDNLMVRPPVVVVLGHVDHGKSSILEAIKDFKITVKESGGITQHIGAYEVEHPSSPSGQIKKITFIDTPGHEAFSAMRSRGARIADIAILVIAADEGVKPQTKEAFLHIKKAEIPMIVAINKIDKSEADPEKAKRELASQDIVVESMGGKVPSVELSAKTKKGIPELLEMILIVSEMEDLKEEVNTSAQGVVIESYLDNFRGPIATLLMQKGILKKGDILGTNSAVGKVKGLENFQGTAITEAPPSMPAIVLGFENVPGVGEQFRTFSDIESARAGIKKVESGVPDTLDVSEDKKILNIILKVDFLGSLEAIKEVLKTLPQDKSILRIVAGGVGDINESDVKLAKSAKAKILGFRVKTNPTAKILASREKITIITFDIIYDLAQVARQMLEKIIKPELVRIDLGRVRILEVFKSGKSRQVIGGKVTDGEIKRGVGAEVLRKEETIGKGKIVGLQRQKKDIDEVAKGSECGILLESGTVIEKGDILVIFTEEKSK